MNRLELDVDVRQGRGKGAARRSRAEGLVPAILYGRGADPIALQIETRALERALQSGLNSLIDLKGPADVKGKLVMVKELQRHPVKRVPIHCDLLAIDTTKKLHVQVPIHYTGKARGVEMGGVLEPVMREVDVICLPLEIPNSFDMDVSELDIGMALHVSDLPATEGVEIASDTSLTLIHVVTPRVVEEETPDEEEGAEAVPAEGEAAEAAAPAGDDSGGGSGGD